jgi:hypothetical protein
MQVWSMLVEMMSICSLVVDILWVVGAVAGSSVRTGVVSQHQRMSTVLGFWDSRGCYCASVVTGRFQQSVLIAGRCLHPNRGTKTSSTKSCSLLSLASEILCTLGKFTILECQMRGQPMYQYWKVFSKNQFNILVLQCRIFQMTNIVQCPIIFCICTKEALTLSWLLL